MFCKTFIISWTSEEFTGFRCIEFELELCRNFSNPLNQNIWASSSTLRIHFIPQKTHIHNNKPLHASSKKGHCRKGGGRANADAGYKFCMLVEFRKGAFPWVELVLVLVARAVTRGDVSLKYCLVYQQIKLFVYTS